MRAKRKPNRMYSFETMKSRIQKAETEAELEVLSDLLDELAVADLVTAYKYRELTYMLDDRLTSLVLEGKI